jgi:hypothetical protein
MRKKSVQRAPRAITIVVMAVSTPDASPILSLTILDSASAPDGVVARSSRVLVVVRDPRANATHPNVVSVPTQRIPPTLRDAILRSASPTGTARPRTEYFTGGRVDTTRDGGHDPTLYATEALLARKLGLAEALERGAVRVEAALRARVQGLAVYDNLGDSGLSEPVDMLNVVVLLSGDETELPLATSSYSLVAWTSVEGFVRGVDSRDPTSFGTRFDPVELCVHGVCLRAAQESLLQLLGKPVFHDAAAVEPAAPRS